MEIVDDSDPDWWVSRHTVSGETGHIPRWGQEQEQEQKKEQEQKREQKKDQKEQRKGKEKKGRKKEIIGRRKLTFGCRNYVALLSSIESEEWYCGRIR